MERSAACSDWHILGGRPLFGRVPISGSKNAALPILFASLLTEERVILSHIPDIADVQQALALLQKCGAEVQTQDGECCVQARNIDLPAPELLEECAAMRGSLYLLGAMLGRKGSAVIGRVGGCDFGGRPIDLHLAAFRALGAKVEEGEDRITVTSPPEGLHGGRISFPIASVGATLNAVLAGVGALGVTEISGAAMEPHVVDTWRFLRKCGADIRWDDRGNIYVTGGKTLHGCCHTLVSDMIEAGTFLAAVGACSGEVELAGANVEELALPIHVLRVMGMEVEKTAAGLIGRCRRALQGCDITTAPYPGFPTDLQPQFAVLLALSKGGGRMTEGVWTNRFRYLDSLSQMGVHSLRQGSTVSFAGQDRLCGSELFSPDLRGGAALLLAALAAEGVTLLHDRGTLARGYERLDKKLRALGADLDLTMSAISPCTPPFAWHTSEQGKQGNGRVK